MNRIEKLIEEMCPEGVPHLTISSFGKIYPGLSGKTKADFGEEGQPFVSYVDIANNASLPSIHLKMVRIQQGENQNNLSKGDILFTASSEDKDGVGLCSEVEFCPEESLYLNSFCFGLRPEEGIFATGYAKHLFRAPSVKKKIEASSNGVTRINLSKKLFGKVKVPIPPLEIQKEIVNILDKFTQLEAELEAELEAREKQYEEVRRRLLDFESDTSNHPLGEMIREMCPEGVENLKIGELAECFSGATPKSGTARYWENGTIPWMSSGEVNLQRVFQTEKKISQEGYDSCSTRMVPKGSVLMALAGQGKTRGKVAINMIELCTNQSLCAMVTGGQLSSEYLYYWLSSKYSFLRSISAGEGGRGGLNLGLIRSIELPVPPLEIQKEIVRILDNLNSLVNSVNEGIPAEIAARRKQYEYYRDKLLTFKELDAA